MTPRRRRRFAGGVLSAISSESIVKVVFYLCREDPQALVTSTVISSLYFANYTSLPVAENVVVDYACQCCELSNQKRAM